MSRFRKGLLAAVGVLAIAALVQYVWGGDRTIEVFYHARRWRGSGQPRLEFQLSKPCELTAVKVAREETPTEAIWKLEPDGGVRKPVNHFWYGRSIAGMKSSPDTPEPLQHGTAYRVIVEAGRRRGEVKFVAP